MGDELGTVPMAQSVARTQIECRETGLQCPRIIWRETTPQHFAGDGGTYVSCGDDQALLSRILRDELDPDLYNAKRYKTFTCVPIQNATCGNWRNAISNSIVEQAGVLL